jgi:hypothetical protein
MPLSYLGFLTVHCNLFCEEDRTVNTVNSFGSEYSNARAFPYLSGKNEGYHLGISCYFLTCSLSAFWRAIELHTNVDTCM